MKSRRTPLKSLALAVAALVGMSADPFRSGVPVPSKGPLKRVIGGDGGFDP